MNKFPGIALLIDDQFDLVYKDDIEYLDDIDSQKLKIQQTSLKIVNSFLTDNHIPYVNIKETSDISKMIDSINSYSNVRLLILDLDLNNDGNVGPEDDYALIFKILETAIIAYGYFFY